MSDIGAVGPGAAAIRHGEVRHQASMVKLLQATQSKAVNPVTVVTESAASAADNNLGKIVDMKT